MADIIKQRLEALRRVMRKEKIDAWIAPTNDFHGSEYIGEYFKTRKYLTGFTGSVGTAVITQKEAWLWTDGRYFIQAEKQLQGTGIHLCKKGMSGVAEMENFLTEILLPGQKVGFDGRVFSASEGKKLRLALTKKKIQIDSSKDLVDQIWDNRPPMKKTAAWFLNTDQAGESSGKKLARIRAAMIRQGAQIHLITALDDIAWIYNMRGDDIACSPVIQAYSIITLKEAFLFVQKGAITPKQERELEKVRIFVKNYEEIWETLEKFSKKTLLLDPEKVNDALYDRVAENMLIKEASNPAVHMKAVKNLAEIKQIREAHLRDGIAMTRYLYWLAHLPQGEVVTEMKAAEHLEKLRAEQKDYLGPSFETISAVGKNAAMCHYIAVKETDTKLENQGFYLVDAGGQYRFGTTDVTRTVAMGAITQEQKIHYTLVLKGMIDLAKARFHRGCTGQMLDYLARGPLLEHGLDYLHGTGHGVGNLLNVHEPPNFIHWRLPEEFCTVFEEGMLTSDEPGLYIEESHGIRIENLLLCVKDEDEEFLRFETVTLCPIDLTALESSYLDCEERKWLNTYHEQVYTKIHPFLSEEEKKWLRTVTRAIPE